MAYTTHGHHIPFSNPLGNPPRKKSCMGANGCRICESEAKSYWRGIAKNKPVLEDAERPVIRSTGIETFQERAKQIVEEYLVTSNRRRHKKLPNYDIFVLWSNQDEKNWKVILGTTITDENFYRVDYDLTTKEFRFNAYKRYFVKLISD